MNTNEHKVIETERLILRPFCEEDLEIICRLYSDPEILCHTPFDTMSRNEAQKHLDRIVRAWKEIPLKEREFAVISKSDGRTIGRCHISTEFESETGMIGWLLLKEEWNRGYATEMTGALLDYCFDNLHLHRVNAICSPENTASCRVLEKCGMRLEAYYRLKCKYLRKGRTEWHDELEYAILAEERKGRSAIPLRKEISE